MAQVNYVRQHIQFMEYAADAHLTTGERLLWYALMHIFNQHARGSDWPDDYVRVNNNRLMTFCPLKPDTINKARASLQQLGLIDFIPGEQGHSAPAYRINYAFFDPDDGPRDEEPPQSYPQPGAEVIHNSIHNAPAGPRVVTLSGAPTGSPSGSKKSGQCGNIYINNTYTVSDTEKSLRDDDDEQMPINREKEAALARAWVRAFGKQPNPDVIDTVLYWGGKVYEFDTSLICSAIKMAGLRCVDSPVDYVKRLLRDWWNRNVRDSDDLENYLKSRRKSYI